MSTQTTQRLSRLPLAVVIAATTLMADVASAQIDEIVVTAQRRAESAQDVPLALTTFDKESLKKLNMIRTEDIAAQTPSLQVFNANFGQAAPVISMRGVSNADFSAISNTPISVYTDGTVLNNVQTHGLALFDLERVEILRGPQGTLFGRNSTTGAIQFISAKPTEELEGEANFSMGSNSAQRVDGYVSGALNDSVRGRFAFVSDRSDGGVRNEFLDQNAQESDNRAARITLEADLTDDLSAEFKAQVMNVDGDNVVFHNDLPVNSVEQDGFLSGFLPPGQSVTQGSGQSDYTKVNLDLPDRGERAETIQASLQLNWDVNDMTFTSITSIVDHDYMSMNDDDNSISEIEHNYIDTSQEQFSQEFRLHGETGALDWVAGVFYMEETVNNAGGFALTDYAKYYDIGGFSFYDAYVFEGVINDGDRLSLGNTRTQQELKSLAVFTHLKYAINDQWSVTGGLRWSQDEKDIDQNLKTCGTFQGATGYTDWDSVQAFTSTLTNPDCMGLVTNKQHDVWEAFTGKASLEYTPTDDVLMYASYTRGFKGGGYQGTVSNARSIGDVRPEFVNAYELGAKTTWMENRVVLNASTFFYDYRDFQATVAVAVEGTNPPLTDLLLRNMPRAEVKGLELELQSELIDNLTINMGLSVLDTEVTESAPEIHENLDGKSFRYAPELTFNGLISYSFEVADLGYLTPQVDWSWSDSYFTDLENTTPSNPSRDASGVAQFVNGEPAQGEVDDLWLVNARLTFSDNLDRYYVTAFVENLEDKIYRTSATARFSTYGTTFSTVGDRRTYGLSFGVKF